MNYKEYYKDKLLEDVTLDFRPMGVPIYNPVGTPVGVVGPTVQNGPRRPGVGTPGGNAGTGNPGQPVSPKPYPQNPITLTTPDINLDHLINRDPYGFDTFGHNGPGYQPSRPQGGGSQGGGSQGGGSQGGGSQGGGSQGGGNNTGYAYDSKGRLIYIRPHGQRPMDLRVRPDMMYPGRMR